MAKKNKNQASKASQNARMGVLPLRTGNYGAGGNKSIVSPGLPVIRQVGTGIRVSYTEPFGDFPSPQSGRFKRRMLFGGAFNETAWLKSVARNYGKFRIHRIRFFYSSVVPTTTAGEVSFAISTEFDDSSRWIGSNPATNADDLLRFQSWVMGPVYGGGSTGMGSGANQFSISQTAREIHSAHPWSFVGQASADSLPNMCYPVQFLLQCGPNGAGEVMAGRIFVDYDVEFSCPVPGSYIDSAPGFVTGVREREEVIVVDPPPRFPPAPKPPKPEPEVPSYPNQGH